MLLVVYEVLLVVYELTGGICQIYDSPAFVWDDVTTIVYVTRFGKRDLFDKNIVLINKQLKIPYIYKIIENRMLVIFYGIIDLVFMLNYTV